MNTCAKGHHLVHFYGAECPCCALIKEMCKLQDKIVEQTNVIEDLTEEVRMYAENKNSK